eukprot:1194965-Prorocentrum_minimum.AAC.3
MIQSCFSLSVPALSLTVEDAPLRQFHRHSFHSTRLGRCRSGGQWKQSLLHDTVRRREKSLHSKKEKKKEKNTPKGGWDARLDIVPGSADTARTPARRRLARSQPNVTECDPRRHPARSPPAPLGPHARPPPRSEFASPAGSGGPRVAAISGGVQRGSRGGLEGVQRGSGGGLVLFAVFAAAATSGGAGAASSGNGSHRAKKQSVARRRGSPKDGVPRRERRSSRRGSYTRPPRTLSSAGELPTEPSMEPPMEPSSRPCEYDHAKREIASASAAAVSLSLAASFAPSACSSSVGSDGRERAWATSPSPG